MQWQGRFYWPSSCFQVALKALQPDHLIGDFSLLEVIFSQIDRLIISLWLVLATGSIVSPEAQAQNRLQGRPFSLTSMVPRGLA